MSKRKTAEEIIEQYPNNAHCYSKYHVLQAIREGMRQERDAALEWAAQNFHTGLLPNWDDEPMVGSDVIKESILSGKTHPDLEIK